MKTFKIGMIAGLAAAMTLAACGEAPRKSSAGKPRLTNAEIQACVASKGQGAKFAIKNQPQPDGSAIVDVGPAPGSATTQAQVDAVTDCISRAAES